MPLYFKMYTYLWNYMQNKYDNKDNRDINLYSIRNVHYQRIMLIKWKATKNHIYVKNPISTLLKKYLQFNPKANKMWAKLLNTHSWIDMNKMSITTRPRKDA